MKHFLAIVLALCVLFGLCGCSSESNSPTEKQPAEEIPIYTLLSDLQNQARAEQNIGKATTMFVTVNTIYSDYCQVNHVLKGGTSDVYMPKEQLAKLTKGQYAAIYAVVDSVNVDENQSTFYYVFKDAHMEDMVLFDEYIAKMNYGSNSGNNDRIYERASFFRNYISARRSALMLRDEEINEYLVGTWERKVTQDFNGLTANKQFKGTHTPEMTIFADGTCKYEYYDSRHTTQVEFMAGEYEIGKGNWTVEDDMVKFEAISSYDRDFVYKISEDVFVWDEKVFVRVD